MASPKADRPWENELSRKSRLRSMEHVKEHHHAEATKRIDERREQRYRRNQTPQEIEEVEDEIPRQQSRHQYRPDQCQQRRIFEGHGREYERRECRAQLWLAISASTANSVARLLDGTLRR
jgi:hypothetical protein